MLVSVNTPTYRGGAHTFLCARDGLVGLADLERADRLEEASAVLGAGRVLVLDHLLGELAVVLGAASQSCDSMYTTSSRLSTLPSISITETGVPYQSSSYPM